MSTTAEKEILGLSYSSNPTAEKIGETFAYCLFFFYRYKTRTCRSIRRNITKFTTNTLITNYKESKTTLHYTTLHYTTLHYTTLHYTTLHYTTLHYTTLHYTTLHYTTLHYTTLHYTTLHYTTLHYTTLHYTTLHYTTLHYKDFITYST